MMQKRQLIIFIACIQFSQILFYIYSEYFWESPTEFYIFTNVRRTHIASVTISMWAKACQRNFELEKYLRTSRPLREISWKDFLGSKVWRLFKSQRPWYYFSSTWAQSAELILTKMYLQPWTKVADHWPNFRVK